MKRKRIFLLFVMILLMASTSTSAVQMETNGDSWFLNDGRIVQTRKVMTENGSEYPSLLCYNASGGLLWKHTFRTPAIGRSFCQLTPDNRLAFMYHDQNYQYFIEYFDPEGNFIAKSTRELQTTSGVLYDGGAVFFEKEPHRVISICHWDGSEKRWEFQGAEKMTLYSVKSFGNNVFIELYMENEQKKAHSILCVDEKENVMRWEYRLDPEHPIKAYTGNEQGGITLFVQKDICGVQYELVMITIDSYGNETDHSRVEGIPEAMAINVISEQKNGIYTLWGYGYDIYGENKVICAKVNTRGNVEVWKECPADYATCVRYLDDEVYVLEYTNGMESFELTPYDEFVNS